jgi:hypothetical protein
MGVFQNEKLLAVENGKSHGNNDRGAIVESMEEGGGEKNFFSHFFEKTIYTPGALPCQFATFVPKLRIEN